MRAIRKVFGKYILEKNRRTIGPAVYWTVNTNPKILFKYIADKKWILTLEGSDEPLATTDTINKAHLLLPKVLARLRAENEHWDVLDLRDLDPPSPEP